MRSFWEGLDRSAVEMIVGASADQEFVDATYLPADMHAEDVQRWCAGLSGVGWVIYLDGDPVGVYRVSDSEPLQGVTLPGGTCEREVWLIEQARGLGVVRQVTEIIAPELVASGVRYLLGIAWEENHPAVRGMAKAGFERLGRVWWEAAHGEEGRCGWCEAWLLDLGGVPASSGGVCT